MDLSSRYSIVTEKSPAEVVLLQGRGCGWKKCTFCDYHLDYGKDDAAHQINHLVLKRVTGQFGHLEVLNSGSFHELPLATKQEILELCQTHHIRHLHFETHWLFRNQIAKIADFFGPDITLHPRIGVETFDEDYREDILQKGMGKGISPSMLKGYYDEMCLLFGIKGQTKEQFIQDITLALTHFDRVYVNLFNTNSTTLSVDPELIKWFMSVCYEPLNQRSDVFVLVNNTDLGVGE